MPTALIIGGSSDIGRAICRNLHNQQAQRYDVHYTHFSGAVAGWPGTPHYCDLRDDDSVRRVIEEVGPLDLLVTAAFPFLEADNFDFNGYIAAEKFLRGHVLAICEATKAMRPHGKIVNILGQCVDKGIAGAAFYSAAYAFLHNLSNSINAREGRSGKLSSHDILLGPVNTRLWKGVSNEVLQRYKAKVQRFLEPSEVAEAVRYIAESEVGPTTFKLDAFYSL